MKYNVGDIVQIKSWDQMKKEFGLSSESINCHKLFTPLMEREMNKERELEIVEVIEIEKCYRTTQLGCYKISDDMIERKTNGAYNIKVEFNFQESL
jgi:hypothetical protein